VQLARATLLRPAAGDAGFIYPRLGMWQAWDLLSHRLDRLGVRRIYGKPARLEAHGQQITAVHAGNERIPCSAVIWTAPLTVALGQLGQPVPRLDYLSLILYNVVARGEPARPFQWCYFGEADIVFSRVSIPRCFSEATSPPGTHGLCVEVTCREGDRRWQRAEALVDRVVDDLVQVDLVSGRADIEDVHVERVADAYPIYHRIYPQELEAARKALAAWSNLHLAGRTGTFWYNNMDHSIENAFKQASDLLGGVPEASDRTLGVLEELRRDHARAVDAPVPAVARA